MVFGRCRLELINSLESEEGVILDNLDNISKEILGFFKKNFIVFRDGTLVA